MKKKFIVMITTLLIGLNCFIGIRPGHNKLIYLPPTIHTTHIDHYPYNYNDKN